MLKCINGVLPHLYSVTAESNRPWSTLSTRVRSQNWMAAFWASMTRMMMPSAGWRWRRWRHSRNEMKCAIPSQRMANDRAGHLATYIVVWVICNCVVVFVVPVCHVLYVAMLLVCQVHHHVLADQRETLLDHIIASVSSNRQTLENAASTKDLDKLWSRINGVCSMC